ncbi:MAG: hypothetical protein H6705_19035 [Myxococcales bacterium]|nr:hypothetical protein [Myxococcales bacterium]
MRDAVMLKMQGFEAERDKLVAAGGESAPTELARLNSRIEEYVRKLDPSMAPQKTTTSTTGKLNQPATNAPPGAPGTGTAPGAAPGAVPGGSSVAPRRVPWARRSARGAGRDGCAGHDGRAWSAGHLGGGAPGGMARRAGHARRPPRPVAWRRRGRARSAAARRGTAPVAWRARHRAGAGWQARSVIAAR